MERILNALRDLTSIAAAPPALLQARSRALATRIPLLYVILVVNMLLLAYAYHGSVSQLLSVWVPGVLTVFCAFRGWWAYRLLYVREADAILIRRQRQTTILALLLAIVFLFWALNLYQAGGTTQKAHVIFLVALTLISCILCLIHLPPAAFGVTAITIGLFSLDLVINGEPGSGLIAANSVLVAGVLIYILLAFNRDFALIIATQQALDAKRAETERLSEENRSLANLDGLTNLSNRRSFFAELRRLLARQEEDGVPIHFGLLDLDGFKPVNDTYGHIAGDEVLREVGRRLALVVDRDIRVARLGGDEFAVVVHKPLSAEELNAFGQKLCTILREPYPFADTLLDLSATAGFAQAAGPGTTLEQLYDWADYALYSAKRIQRGSLQVFSSDMQQQYHNAQLTEQLLHRADLDAEMFLEFQPIVCVETGEVLAMEALARWLNPQLGRVSPDKFIAAAERSPLIHRLTASLFAKALAAVAEWPGETQLTFNLSVRDLTSRETVLKIVTMIEKSGLSPRRLVFEITETALMRDYESALESLTLLKRLGVGIALDDFGTGYSSLSYVHRLPLDKIKIDRSFVRALSNNLSSRDIIRTIVQLCGILHLDCVAEGIETQSEADALRALGCNKMQGYFFARPMSASDAVSFLARRKAERSAA